MRLLVGTLTLGLLVVVEPWQRSIFGKRCARVQPESSVTVKAQRLDLLPLWARVACIACLDRRAK